MYKKKGGPNIDLSDLPANWTMRDVEKRLPEEYRKQRWPYKLTLMVNPLPTTPPGVTHAEFFVEFNYDERDAFTAAMQKYVDSGRLGSFVVEQICVARADFADAIIRCLSEAK